jgi:hypothetical protein
MTDDNKIVEPFKKSPSKRKLILTGFLLELLRILWDVSANQRDEAANIFLNWEKPRPNPYIRLGLWLANELLKGKSK